MDTIDYSVLIRTTGNAHEKYQRLLDSINTLQPAPKEVIVVLPVGYELPDERLGYESFFFAPKGMVSQRLAGVEKCSTAYALVCDDDVCFGPDFVQNLYRPLRDCLGAISAGPLYSFLPSGFSETLFDCIRGAACPTVWHRDRYASVLRTTGYSYNRHLKESIPYYESQSVAGTCFFIDVAAFRSLHLEDEIWIDSHGYAAMEDQTMIYKAWLNNKKTIVVFAAKYEHLDAKTSRLNKNPNIAYSLRFNRYVFWRRFLYEQQPNALLRIWTALAFAYRLFWEAVYSVANVLRRRKTLEACRRHRNAWAEARAFTRSEEYARLPGVKE